jgi:hypothetical protein
MLIIMFGGRVFQQIIGIPVGTNLMYETDLDVSVISFISCSMRCMQSAKLELFSERPLSI